MYDPEEENYDDLFAEEKEKDPESEEPTPTTVAPPAPTGPGYRGAIAPLAVPTAAQDPEGPMMSAVRAKLNSGPKGGSRGSGGGTGSSGGGGGEDDELLSGAITAALG
jgi:uncharacterized membrane protein YgcG